MLDCLLKLPRIKINVALSVTYHLNAKDLCSIRLILVQKPNSQGIWQIQYS
jgi:hypothetical protein